MPKTRCVYPAGAFTATVVPVDEAGAAEVVARLADCLEAQDGPGVGQAVFDLEEVAGVEYARQLVEWLGEHGLGEFLSANP
jgi:hypothetical protein